MSDKLKNGQTSMKILQYFRPLTQNRLIKPQQASALILKYQKDGDINPIIQAIDDINTDDCFTPLKEHIKKQIMEEK
jgi:hypothetical protein